MNLLLKFAEPLTFLDVVRRYGSLNCVENIKETDTIGIFILTVTHKNDFLPLLKDIADVEEV